MVMSEAHSLTAYKQYIYVQYLLLYLEANYILRVILLVPKAVTNGITVVHRRKILAAFFEKCPEQYTM